MLHNWCNKPLSVCMDLISAERYWLDESITSKIRRNKTLAIPAWSEVPQRKFISWPSNLVSSRCNRAIYFDFPRHVLVGFCLPLLQFLRETWFLIFKSLHLIIGFQRAQGPEDWPSSLWAMGETASVLPGILWVLVAVFAITPCSPFQVPIGSPLPRFHVAFLYFEWFDSDRCL